MPIQNRQHPGAQKRAAAQQPADVVTDRQQAWLDWTGARARVRMGRQKLLLATLHAFNDWADVFLTTPAAGLQDRYAGVQRGFDWGGHKGKWVVAFHDFQADRGEADYGREWDASLGLALRPGLDALVKMADYRSDGFARDIRKAWLQLQWAY